MIGRARLFFAGVLFVALAAGARPASADVGVGAKFGPLFSKFDSDVVNFDSRTGLIGGLFIGGHREGTAGIQLDLLYAKKSTNAPGGAKLDLHYFEIPVLGRFNFGSHSTEGVAGYIIVGPSFDIKLKAKQNGLDVSDNYEGLDLGIIGGAGVELSRFIIEGRYNWGLRNVNKTTTTEIKDKTFALMFGVRFN